MTEETTVDALNQETAPQTSEELDKSAPSNEEENKKENYNNRSIRKDFKSPIS